MDAGFLGLVERQLQHSLRELEFLADGRSGVFADFVQGGDHASSKASDKVGEDEEAAATEEAGEDAAQEVRVQPVPYSQIIKRPPEVRRRRRIWQLLWARLRLKLPPKLRALIESLFARLRKPAVLAVAGVFAVLMALETFSFLPGAQLRKNFAIFEQVYEDVYKGYVDPVDPTKLMQVGIEGMLGSLDPYTTFIDEANTEELGVLTHGRYGGVGITIGESEGKTMVFGTLDGYSAFEKGVRTGDRITHVGKSSVEGLSVTDVRNMLRGDPGSTVSVTFERLTSKNGAVVPVRKTATLQRARVQLKNVTYAGFLDDDRERGIGYLRLDRFASQSGQEVREAVKAMEAKGRLRGLVVDVRGNPGGLLEAAVDVASTFVPRGSVVVSTQGRLPESRRVYRSRRAPVMPDVPLVVLTNAESASASEIVAGAVQDLDRGLVVGEKTFGKGLIQKIKFLPYNTALKYTIGKYYTASGRCIQAVDYSPAGGEAAGVPAKHLEGGRGPEEGVAGSGPGVEVSEEERREFATRGGRRVRDGGGIEPDVRVATTPQSAFRGENAPVSELEEVLASKLHFFRFANLFAARHPAPPDWRTFAVSPALLSEFESWLRAGGFAFQSGFESVFDALAAEMRERGYSTALSRVAAVRAEVAAEKRRDFGRHEAAIRERLRDEILARYFDERTRVAATLRRDPQLQRAVEILQTPSEYARLLAPPPKGAARKAPVKRAAPAPAADLDEAAPARPRPAKGPAAATRPAAAPADPAPAKGAREGEGKGAREGEGKAAAPKGGGKGEGKGATPAAVSGVLKLLQGLPLRPKAPAAAP